MKFLSAWSIRPGSLETAVQRFFTGQAEALPGMTILGRWYKTDGSGGYTLSETDDPSVLFEYAAIWVDVFEIHSTAVIEDAQAAPILAKRFKK